jgi:hypothetical protein
VRTRSFEFAPVLTKGLHHLDKRGGLSWVGAAASEEEEKLARAAKDFIAGDSSRDAYVRGAKDGCVARIQLNKPAGMSSRQQIAAFCDCFANNLVKLITVEDYIYQAKNKRMHADFQEKTAQARAACRAAVNDANKT